MKDICLVSIPYISYTLPPAAPATLMGHLKSRGFTAIAKEFNIKFKHKINNDKFLNEIVLYLTENSETLSPEVGSLYQQVLHDLSKELVEANCKWIGLSVFSPHSVRFCQDFLPILYNHKPSWMRIVIGGAAVDVLLLQTVQQYIDAHIQGEGELALENLLQNNFDYPGINKPGIQIEDLENLGFPDYSDYDLDAYDHFYGRPSLQITSSRGCVRHCTFCNVESMWPTFRFKSGKKTAEEMIFLHETTGAQDIFFTDSLINGNLKELTEMMRIVSDYKKSTGSTLSWGGQWIARKQKGLPKNYYQLLKESGAKNLIIGVETGSDAVRAHMKKGFTNQDLDQELEEFSKHGITCGFLMILGYPTETEDDFEQTLQMFLRYVKYVADGTIIGVSLGGGFGLDPKFGLGKNVPILKEENKLFKFLSKDKQQWRSLVTNASFIENYRRRIIAQQVIDNLEWPCNDVLHDTSTMIPAIDNLLKTEHVLAEIKKLKTDDLSLSDNYQLPSHVSNTQLSISLKGTQGINWPKVKIYVNKKCLGTYDVKDQMILNFDIDLEKRNILKIELINKYLQDTKVDNGKITRDKTVLINELKIHDIRINKDKLLQRGKFIDSTGKKCVSHGLFQNGCFKFYFTNQIPQFFIKQQEFFWSKVKDRSKNELSKLITYYKMI